MDSEMPPKSQAAVLRRRVFLGAGLGAACAGVSCTRGAAGRTWRFFTPAQAETVDAICAQLIPADQDAGAKEARVVDFIDLQLAIRFKKHRAAYRQGVDAVDAASRSAFGKPFVDLAAAQQTEVLNVIEEKLPAFFDLILTHARQGFYGDPRHGGNRDRVSWRMLGLSFPPVRGREHYEG